METKAESEFRYPFFPPRRRGGAEALIRTNDTPCATVADYWTWSSSDLVSNVERGVFAEFLVTVALGQGDGVRDPCATYDVKTADGVAVEVKSASYLQRWAQKELTPIEFGIAPSTKWDPQTNRFVGTRRRQGDVYVFCLLAHEDQATINPLDLAQWRFFVLETAALDAKSPTQKKITLKSLLNLGADEVSFEDIPKAVSRRASVAARREVFVARTASASDSRGDPL